ncbi:Secreted RxLR effector protein 28, partial [Frankliniella fusca]
TYCCLAEPPPAAPAVRDAATNAAPTAPAPPPDPLTKAPPPASFLNTNALSSRPQRAAADEVRNNVDDDPGEQDKHEAQPPTVTLVGAHVNHTLAAAGLGAAANNSYQVFLSRHLPDQELQLHVRFTRPWLKPEQCDSSAAQQCPQELAGVGPGSSWGQPAAGAGPADAAAKQHLSRAGEAAVAADARAAAASDDEHIIFVKIAFHVSNTVVFRVPLGGNPNDVCKRTASFQEYRIHFVRRCDL